jgi:hypothetical protein
MNFTRCGQCGRALAADDLVNARCSACGARLPDQGSSSQQAELVTRRVGESEQGLVGTAFPTGLTGGTARATDISTSFSELSEAAGNVAPTRTGASFDRAPSFRPSATSSRTLVVLVVAVALLLAASAMFLLLGHGR